MSRNRSSLTKSSDAGEDFIRRLRPDEWLGRLVGGGQVEADGVHQLPRALVGAAAQLFLGEQEGTPRYRCCLENPDAYRQPCPRQALQHRHPRACTHGLLGPGQPCAVHVVEVVTQPEPDGIAAMDVDIHIPASCKG